MKNAKAYAIACSLVLSLGLGACGGSGNDAPASEPTKEATTAVETETAEVTDTTTETTTTEAPAAETQASETPAAETTATTSAQSAQSTYIADTEAISIALENAGANEASVTELECELDLDDPVVHYDVDFKFSGMDYDYDIDATTGEIIYVNSEVDD